jgi:hypothetical protein
VGKGTTFFGQPLYGRLINLLDKAKILQLSRQNGGERYIKKFDGWQHLIVMLYAVIMRFDSLREIEASMFAEAHKLHHLGIFTMPYRTTLADANHRRPAAFFEAVYRYLYTKYKYLLFSDSRNGKSYKWMERLHILDSSTISLFSNLVFKGAGRNPKTGKKKGGIKVHAIMHANEGVASDVCYTSAATHDSFMLAPSKFSFGDILAIDRAYINYAKFEQLTQMGIIYVTKMKSNLKYKVSESCNYQNTEGLTEIRVQVVEFEKKVSEEEIIKHRARIVSYYDKDKKKFVTLLTNDFNMDIDDIIEIYRQRWQIELLFKQIKQNFPLHFFYGESENAIKIQVWLTLIANLLMTIIQKQLKRKWSFSGLCTMMRILLMHYVGLSFFEEPESGWQAVLAAYAESPPKTQAIQQQLF